MLEIALVWWLISFLTHWTTHMAIDADDHICTLLIARFGFYSPHWIASNEHHLSAMTLNKRHPQDSICLPDHFFYRLLFRTEALTILSAFVGDTADSRRWWQASEFANRSKHILINQMRAAVRSLRVARSEIKRLPCRKLSWIKTEAIF